ncbi:o-succinylbenzoate synthase [Aquimarina agarivorans]|uniref:o-succinylbenzoate synthase n=1 Tax=Aquimarina agarivorans TaxID=980584 RepID=UPI000248F2F2|nr:o-succinylbenzoate synthase [Aquimarina agarivorans]
MEATYFKHILKFKRPSGTSRGVLKTKETWFIKLTQEGKIGIGECGILRTLSIDDTPEYESTLKWACANIHMGEKVLYDKLKKFPSIQFGIEQAFLSLKSDSPFELFPSDFTQNKVPIPINGLVWMGAKDFMKQQILEKLNQGFNCIKLKIGAIDFESELALLKYIRSQFSENEIEIRVDANGAFSSAEALQKLKALSSYKLHSIEQPIGVNQPYEMAELCKKTPLPIALDEELIGVIDFEAKTTLLEKINPQYIILKPSLIGGFKGSLDWIRIAKANSIDWWITSALESNVGLNAISQFTFTLNNPLPQGLGTGSLYTNNISSPLVVENGTIFLRY